MRSLQCAGLVLTVTGAQLAFYDFIIAVHHMSREEVLLSVGKKDHILDQVCKVEYVGI